MDLKTKIKTLMTITGTTQTDIAKKLGKLQQFISTKINNIDSLRVTELENIVNAMGCTVTITFSLPDGTKF